MSFEGIDWDDEDRVEVTEAGAVALQAPGAVVAVTGVRPVDATVEVVGAREALVVGPDEVLVITFPDGVTREDLEHIRDRFLDSRLSPDRLILISGDAHMTKVKHRDSRADTARDYRRPGRTVDL